MTGSSTLNYILGDHLALTGCCSRYNSGALPTKYTYTGQYSNRSDFGLMNYNARWYDPALGRFAQADTLIPQPSDPQSWDRYAYVENNPLRYTDPSGHFTGDPNDPSDPDGWYVKSCVKSWGHGFPLWA